MRFMHCPVTQKFMHYESYSDEYEAATWGDLPDDLVPVLCDCGWWHLDKEVPHAA